MTYILLVPGVVIVIGLVVLISRWRRSRQHIGIARPSAPAGPADALNPTVTPGSVSYKQVVSPGSQSPDIDAIPLRNVEDALAQRPGPLEPGKTISPAGPGKPAQNPQPPEDPPPQS